VYVLTALVITGMVNYKEFLGVADPLAYVFEKTGLTKLNYLISISAVVATTSVLLVFQIGQPRIWMTMSRDGLLPKAFSRVHPKFHTPSFATVVTGFLVAVPALFLDAALMTDLTSIGTLFAFVLVCGGVLMLPTEDKQIGKFKLPYINGQFIIPVVFLAFLYTFQERIIGAFANIGNQPHQEYLLLIFLTIATVLTIYTALKRWSFIPVMGVLFCTYLMIEIPVKSWFVFFGWMAFGLLIYFTYSQKNSKLA
jgi:amino acid transporter